MSYYKAPNDPNPHFLDDDSFVHLLPAGSIQITDEEAEAMRPKPDPKLTRIAEIDSEILSLEAKSHRAVRDSLAALAVTAPPSIDDVTKIKEISAAIETLRLERRSLLAT